MNSRDKGQKDIYLKIYVRTNVPKGLSKNITLTSGYKRHLSKMSSVR